MDADRAYSDSYGNVWIQFTDGLYRVSAAKPGLRELLVSTTARVIYSDRHGDLWVGTNGEGLMRFTDRVVSMYTKESGLPNNTVMTALTKKDGSLWVGNNCGGLSVYRQGRFRTYTEKDGLSNSCVWSVAEDERGTLWIGTWGGGLFRLENEHFTQFSKINGLAGNIVRAIAIARDHSLWIATDFGISHFANGAFHNYTTADGLSSNTILDVREDRDGNLWTATIAGVDRKFGERFRIAPSPDQIVDLHSADFAESLSRNLYVIGSPKGLDLIAGGRLTRIYSKLELTGMLVHRQDFWLGGMNGIFRFAAKELAPGAEERQAPRSQSFKREPG